MERRRRAGLVALGIACVGGALYVFMPPSPEAEVRAFVTELASAGGLSGKAAPPQELEARLVRALKSRVDVLTPEDARHGVDRQIVIEFLVPLAERFSGVYSLYDLRVEVRATEQGDAEGIEAIARGRLGPRDRRNEVQGLDSREFALHLEKEGEHFVVVSVELSAALSMEPEARP